MARVLETRFKMVPFLILLVILLSNTPATSAQHSVTLGITGTATQFTNLSSQGLPLKALAYWEPWSVKSPEPFIAEATEHGAIPLINWQPEGNPTYPVTLPMIVHGEFDAYIESWARTIQNAGTPVYLRLAHEMNGTWYPWSKHGARMYQVFFKRTVGIFKRLGVTNAKFVWSPDGLIGHEQAAWEKRVTRWWPGKQYVDYVGMSMVVFKSSAKYGLPYFFKRLNFLHGKFKKPVILPEVKVYAGERYPYLSALRTALVNHPWVKMLVWSETPSTAQAEGQFETGQMNWSLSNDPKARRLLKAAVR